MAQRRDRPAVERSGESLNIKLPDGTTMSVPLSTSRPTVSADICCFCGATVEHADPQRIRVDAHWEHDGGERRRSWGAHDRCLLERLHDRATGQEPFFD